MSASGSDTQSGATRLRRTDVFTETTIPPGLLRNHQTRDGVWGRIVVLEGALRYTVLEPTATETRLVPGRAGIVEPTVPHQVAPIGPVRFYVEFLRVQRENTSAT